MMTALNVLFTRLTVLVVADHITTTQPTPVPDWAQFGQIQPGRSRVKAICDLVHGHPVFGCRHARVAAPGAIRRQGV
ncbi:MAG: hypothetical protein WBQ78_17805 [Gammaproteobacteria bacterium]